MATNTVTTTVTSDDGASTTTTTTTTTTTSKASSGGKMELRYWPGRGLMEVSRVCLAIAGKFPGDYTDGRFTTSDDAVSDKITHFSTIKDDLACNMGRVPMVKADGQSAGQSMAVWFYVATECGMMGKTTMEAAQIIGTVEHVKEMNSAYRNIIPYGTEPSKENLAKWFDEGAEDSTGIADGSKRSERFAKWFMGRIEVAIGANGFSVGDALSLADVVIYNTFAETLSEEQAMPGSDQYKREPFGSKVHADKALESCPKIKAVCDRVAAHPNMQKWLSERGVQGF